MKDLILKLGIAALLIGSQGSLTAQQLENPSRIIETPHLSGTTSDTLDNNTMLISSNPLCDPGDWCYSE